ncbi:MAG: alpha/beta hydrolase [Gilvibacter sp.]
MKTLFKTLFGIACLAFLGGFAPNNSAAATTIAYTLHGDGPKKVIVLHSWMGDYQSWLPTIAHLDLKQHSFAFVDVRGYGKSKDIKGDYNSDEVANDIFDVAKKLGWDRYFLIGHSMTGMAVQKAAVLDASNAIIKVMAITPVSSAGFPVDQENLNFFKAIVHDQEVANKAFRAFTSNRLSDTWYSNQAKRHVAVTNKEAQLGYIDMWTGEDFSSKMSMVKTPFTVLYGQYDHPGFSGEAQKKAFALLQQVSYVEVENAGHFPMQETPVFLAAQIEQFLN